MTPFETRARRLAIAYLDALAAADLRELLALFTAGAMVHSPLYGQLPANEFYAALFKDTQTSVLHLQDVLVHPGRRTLAILFRYEWQLASGQWNTFDVIDWVRLAETDHIAELRILYDTKQLTSGNAE